MRFFGLILFLGFSRTVKNCILIQIAIYPQVSSYSQLDIDKISGSMKLVTFIITVTTCCEFEPTTFTITTIPCSNLVTTVYHRYTTEYPCSEIDTNFISCNCQDYKLDGQYSLQGHYHTIGPLKNPSSQSQRHNC